MFAIDRTLSSDNSGWFTIWSGEITDPEEKTKLEKSLEKLSDLVDKGLEIHTSIETPKEIKVLFPFVETQKTLPDNLLKYIEDKSKGNKE